MTADHYTEGHCPEKRKPGGCQLHNLHCGYPKCDRKPAHISAADLAAYRGSSDAAQECKAAPSPAEAHADLARDLEMAAALMVEASKLIDSLDPCTRDGLALFRWPLIDELDGAAGILRDRLAQSKAQPKGMPAEWLDAFEEWRQTLGAADLDGKRDLVWRHIAGTGFQAGAAWARSQAPAPAPDDKALTQALEERDAASDYIDALLDEVLGKDRHEWTSNYGHADAMAEVRERMATVEGLEKAVAAGFPVVARWTKNAKDGAPRARVWVQFEDGGPEVEFTSDLQAPAVGDGQ